MSKPGKEMTLAALLDEHSGDGIVLQRDRSEYVASLLGTGYWAATPEDALQGLVDALHPGRLLDVDRSEAWRAEYGPDEDARRRENAAARREYGLDEEAPLPPSHGCYSGDVEPASVPPLCRGCVHWTTKDTRTHYYSYCICGNEFPISDDLPSNTACDLRKERR